MTPLDRKALGRLGRVFQLGPSKPPRCPLCHKDMERMWVESRRCFVFKCDTVGSCKIAIKVDDPFVGRWDAALEKAGAEDGGKILCPNPRCAKAPFGEMRFFATQVGYMKAYCPECHATMHNSEVERKADDPTAKTYTPDSLGPLQ